MKLLDLQTGNLELGKEWVYGGKDIYVIPTHYLRISKTDHVVKLYYDDKVEIINCELPDEYKVVNGIGRLYAKGQFSKYIINGNEYDMGYFTEVNSLTPINDAKKCEKSEPPLKLKEICEETGAVVYGGRYVLMQSILYEGQDEFNTIQGFVGDIAITSIGEFLMLCYGKKSQYCNIQKFHTKTKFSQVYFYDSNDGVEMLLRCKIGHNLLVNGMVKNEYKGNIFEEYSKQLRNEPNKFDELNQHFK